MAALELDDALVLPSTDVDTPIEGTTATTEVDQEGEIIAVVVVTAPEGTTATTEVDQEGEIIAVVVVTAPEGTTATTEVDQEGEIIADVVVTAPEGTTADAGELEQGAVPVELEPHRSVSTSQWNQLVASLRMVCAAVGFAVLMLPYALSNLNVTYGLPVMIVSWCTSLIMVDMHEARPTRLNTYTEIVQHAFGDGCLLKLEAILQFTIRIGTNVVHAVFAGQSVQVLMGLVNCSSCVFHRVSVCIGLFGAAQLILSLVPDLFSHPLTKFTAFLLILSYCIVISYGSMGVWEKPQRRFQPHKFISGHVVATKINHVMGILAAMGQIAFAFSGQNDVPEIQNEVFSTLRRSKGRMARAVSVSYIVVGCIYSTVAMTGYWRFGDRVNSNIVLSLQGQGPFWLHASANSFIVLQLIISYQIKARPAFGELETLLGDQHWLVRLKIIRLTYTFVVLRIAIAFPFTKGYVTLIGGIANASIIYLFPLLVWNSIYKQGASSLSTFFRWVVVPITGIVIIVSVVGGLFNVKNETREFQFFH